VLIPARNETEDLETCLQTVIGSDYPKLEILVLDDCSQNRRTPEIIRSFAHDGVRFIQGEIPRDTWLPKNEAYRRLSSEASGEYLLFCGADARFASDSIRQLIGMMLANRKRMVSILPLRTPAAAGRFSVVQAMRYWWELAPPRRLFNRPAVLSSCWVIAAAALHEAGGFEAVSRSIVPEAYFAKRLLQLDGYSFRRSSVELGIQSVKSVSEQRDTATRTRYPQVHRRPEQVLLVALAEIVFLVMPFVLAIGGFWLPIGPLAHVLSVVTAILLTYIYAYIARSTRINTWWFALIAQPVVAIVDIALLHYSMWQYEFSEVTWKGRNVCVPVMHVIPHLPKA
jgi:glycosyltransferase involved in cell wall biosynthesis